MGHDEAANLLQETLEEEKAADEKLTAIAESGINQDAADAAHPEGEEEEEDDGPVARPRRQQGRCRSGREAAAPAITRTGAAAPGRSAKPSPVWLAGQALASATCEGSLSVLTPTSGRAAATSRAHSYEGRNHE